jgi:hypothetical protein
LKNVFLFAVLVALAVAIVPQATARQHSAERDNAARASAASRIVEARMSARLLRHIVARRDETWRWQRTMLRPRTPFGNSANHVQSLRYRKWVLGLWHRRAVAAKRKALNPPHKAQWLCIHRYEGSWTDSGSPYYGGLQMDLGFQQTYGLVLYRAKGTADHWTPLEQMWVAERAYTTRGYWPWPNTARYCGLI